MRIFFRTMCSVKDILKENIYKRIHFKGESSSLDELRNYFSKLGNGSVDLTFGENGIATVTLNNPQKRNAISGRMMSDLLTVVEKLEKWTDGKGVIVKGFGGNFCSGGDLSLAREGTEENGYKMATMMDQILTRFHTLPLLTVAVIEGCGALGGGAEISVACDFRLIATSSSGLGFVHGRMGIITAWGGAKRLYNLVGYTKALQILSSAKILTPQELLNCNLVNEIIPNECNADEFTNKWLSYLTPCMKNVVQGLKLQVLLASHAQDEADINNRLFAPYWGCDDNKAALAANIKHKIISKSSENR